MECKPVCRRKGKAGPLTSWLSLRLSLDIGLIEVLKSHAMKVDISYEVQCVVLGQSQVLKAMQSG